MRVKVRLKGQPPYINNNIPDTDVKLVNTLVHTANTRWLSSTETDTLAPHKPHHHRMPSSNNAR